MVRLATGADCRRRTGRCLWRAWLPAVLAALLLGLHATSMIHSSRHSAQLMEEEGASPFSSEIGTVQAAMSLDAAAALTTANQRRQAASTRADPAAGSLHAGSLDPQYTAGEQQEAPPRNASNIVFVTFGNTAFWEFTHNWVLSVQRLGLPFLVGALDEGMSELCRAAGYPHMDLWRHEGGSATAGGNSDFFRTDFKTFRHMGATKVQLTLSILEADNGVETVVVSDSDTVWLKDPTDYLDQHPVADWFISTDCLSHEVEAQWAPNHNVPRCGHVPDNIWGRAYNTGVFAVRNRPSGKRLLALWRDLLLDPQKATVKTESNQTFGITDQLALNILLDEGVEYELHSDPRDSHVTLHRDKDLRLHPLPVLLFPNGHAAFVQRLPWRHGVQPYVVHATFQRYGTSVSRFGKRGRFRQFGMWFLDGPEYYNPPGARYLTYDNNVREYVDRLGAKKFGGAIPVLYKHIIALSYQLAQFRDALAAATMLNRTLVLPPSWCWCDYDWTPHVLEKCKIRGSDLQLPFECPADFVFHIPAMDLFQPPLNYRVPGFLEDPRSPPELRLSRGELRVLGHTPFGPGDDGSEDQPLPSFGGAAVHMGATEEELLDVALPLEHTAVVTISNMAPGMLQRFASDDATRAFDTLFYNITDQLYWCCAAEGSLETAVFWYELPRPMIDGYWPWQPPVMEPPPYCNQPGLSPEELEVMHYPNHPCQFLTNTTAAAISAALS